MTKKLTTRGPGAAEAIADRIPFHTHGALWAADRDHGPGHMPNPWRTQYDEAWKAGKLDYVVYSYATPIAWHTEDGWVIPDIKYSATTSHHQGHLYLVRP